MANANNSDIIDYSDLELDVNLDYSEDNHSSPSFHFRDEPIQLITFANDGFKLNQEALLMLSSIEEDIIVVAVVGKARTGKSYLMNLLLDNVGKNKGFQVDSKISSCTKGIWMWGNYKKSLTGNNTKIIFIDSEGTSATDRGTKTYDSRIFALVVLISSLFIYNTTSNIDENGISELSLAAHLSNAISTNSNIDKDHLLNELAPKFIWLLRDFTLEKTHPETGAEISSKEYLEICLRKKISGKNSADNNLIRNNIIKYFPERDCVTLVRPVESEEDLRRLNEIPYDRLKPNFKYEFKSLKDKVYKETVPKKINGKKLNGLALSHLIVEFVNVINSGNVPNINNSWDSVVSKDINDYYEKSLNLFKKKALKLESSKGDLTILLRQLYQFKFEAFKNFNKLLMLNSDSFSANNSYNNLYEEALNKLKEEIDKTFEKTVAGNIQTSSNLCNEFIKNQFREIEKKIYDEYYTPQLILELCEDYRSIVKNYNESEQCKGQNKLIILFENIKTEDRNIFEYIKKISDKHTESKLLKIDRKLRDIQNDLEDVENLNKKAEDINAISESRIKNFEKSIETETNVYKEKKEIYENKLKELKQLKEMREKELEKKDEEEKRKLNKKQIKELGDYNDEEGASASTNQNNKKKKKEACHCGCQIY